MADLILNLSLIPVGPRANWRTPQDNEWLFALQVAASFSEPDGDAEPAGEAEQRDWALAMLPWKLLTQSDATTRIDVQWVLLRRNGDRVTGGQRPARAIGMLDPLAIRSTLETRFPDFATFSQPPRSFAGPADGKIREVTHEKMLLPPVLQALGGSTPELTSGELRCTWYFTIPVNDPMLNAMIESTDAVVAAWPLRFFDTRNHQSVEFFYEDQPGRFRFADGVVSVRYRAQAQDPLVHAQLRPFPVKRFRAPDEPALNTYWLPTSDSRLDSVAEIHHVVSDALKLRARSNYLLPDLLVSAGVKRADAIDALADARAFVDVARRLFDVGEATDVLRAQRETLAQELIASALRAMKAEGIGFLDALRRGLIAEAKRWWTSEAAAAINARARREGVIAEGQKDFERGDADSLFAGFGLFVIPAKTDVRPVLPGEGIDVLLGDPQLRLRHEGEAGVANDSDHAHIAELGVLVRRATHPFELTQRRWSIATSAVAALDPGEELEDVDRYWGSNIDPDAGIIDETIDYHHRPLARGIKSVFIDGLSRTDLTYRGAPLIASTIGSALHAIPGEQEEGASEPLRDLLPLSYQPVGPVRGQVADSEWSLVPPLRYGDWYQFAGFVIDRGGGIPAELASPGAMPIASSIEWPRLNAGVLAELDDFDPENGKYRAIEFLRRVPVGEVNLLPPPDPQKPTRRPQWPPLPGNVVLRAREWLATQTTEVESIPALLLSDGDGIARGQKSYEFRVTAPALDEHTISRWMMPPAIDPSDNAQVQAAQEQLDALNDVLAEIHRRRDALLTKRAALLPRPLDWQEEAAPLPPDPAVSKIGLRCHFVDENGVAREQRSFLATDANVTVAIASAESLVNPIALRPGTFAVIELLPLVRMSDFERFESLAMQELTEELAWSDERGEEYKAFRAARIIVEAATAALPDPRAIYNALTLAELPNGAIDVSLIASAALDNMAFVDRFELARQRWVWRNRPILLPKSDKLQGELPRELAVPPGTDNNRDVALPVLQFDALAELDRGMVDRGRVGGRVPRMADGTPLASMRLLVDDRDAVSHADYLRFGCTLISRYAGVLEPSRQQVLALGAPHDDSEKEALEKQRTWRRIAARFRGDSDRLKAPKVLAILPLTQGLPNAHVHDVSADATPFLIVLDEIWFREYGAGERLSVEVVLETKEIGELDDEKRPFRVGPLPDHYVAQHLTGPNFNEKRLYGFSIDKDQDTADAGKTNEGNRTVFPVYGPFGHSLDRSGNEALANATAFVAYAPEKVQSHYAAFVRLRRTLSDIQGNIVREGPAGGTYALYTQPDATQLASDGARVTIHHPTYEASGITLRPAVDTAMDVARQYRYLLIVGPLFRDFGRGTDLFLPTHAAWLDGSNRMSWAHDPASKVIGPGRDEYRGRVLELLLNGRFEGEPPIVALPSLQKILQALFVDDGNPEDAPAMIRRISSAFTVIVE